MQGASAFALRERRAAAARARTTFRPTAEPSLIQEIWPDAPAPKLVEAEATEKSGSEAPQSSEAPPVHRSQAPSQTAQSADKEPEGMDEEARAALMKLRSGQQLQDLRSLVKKDPKALERFLEELTSSNPELMRIIALHQKEFLEMLTGGLAEEARKSEAQQKNSEEGEIPEPPVHLQQERKAKAEKQMKDLRAFMPSTSSCHTLALLHSPYSCAVCKGTKELLLCSMCHCVRFCSKEHQRQFWPRHQSVCKFISSVKGGLLTQVSGLPWLSEALPQIGEVWMKSRGAPPQPWELEQLVHMPRCRVCKKVPATLVCKRSKYAGYCSEACRDKDTEHINSWQCGQVGATALVAAYMHKAGGCVPYTTRVSEEAIPDSLFDCGWQDFVKFAALATDQTDFLKLPSLAQQSIIDALSFPLIAMEGLYHASRPIERLSRRQNLKVHVLGAYGSTLADPGKYEEWLHRVGSQCAHLDVHFVGPEVLLSGDGDHVESSVKMPVSDSCKSRDRTLTLHFHRCKIADFIDEEISASSSPPAFRVAYSPAFGKVPAGHPEDSWSDVLERLAKLQDAVPLIVSERTNEDIYQDRLRARACGFKTLVKPMNSKFPSPLVLYDEVRPPEENPLGLLIWNMALAVFEARSIEEPESEDSESDAGEEEETDEARKEKDDEKTDDKVNNVTGPTPTVPEDFVVGEQVLVQRCQSATVSGLRTGGYPESVEVRHGDGSRRHYLPGELEHLRPMKAASTSSTSTPIKFEALTQTPPLLSLKGPYSFDGQTFQDEPYCAEANPESFIVSLSVRCTGGKGFRSPLTCRDEKPSSGYLFYADNDDRWAFWIGDGVYWTGVRGPKVSLDKWTLLQGAFNASTKEASFHVDGLCVGTRAGADFVANRQRPLRIGAGRSEEPVARYFFHGDVRDVIIHEIVKDQDLPENA